MGKSAIQFCDVCQGSISPASGVRLPTGAVYCVDCCAKVMAKEAAGGKALPPPDVAGKPPKVRLPAWSLATVCLTILLLTFALGATIFLAQRVQQLSDRLRQVDQNLAQVSQTLAQVNASVGKMNQVDPKLQNMLALLLGHRPGDPDNPGMDKLFTEGLQKLMDSRQEEKGLIDDLLKDIGNAGRAQPRRPETRPAPDRHP